MDIQVNKLREALDLLRPAVPHKPTLKVLENVWLGDGKAIAMDMETAVRVSLPDIADEPPLLLPFKETIEFLKRAPGHRVARIGREGAGVILSVDGAQASFAADDVEDYPPMPRVDGEGQGVLDGDALIRAMRAVAPYAATEDVRPVLKAVCLAPGDAVEVAAADGFRLAWEPVPGRLAGDKPMVIPVGTVEVLDHVWKRAARPDLSAVSDPAGLARAKRFIRLGWSDARLQFSFGEVAVVAQLIQGTFPNYRQLIPAASVATVTFVAEDMERALRQLAPAAKDASDIVRLAWEGEQLVLSAKSDKLATSVPIPATCTGPGRVAVNRKFLLEYFRGKTGTVTMAWSSQSSPVVLSRRDHPHVVIMPMFVQWGDEPKVPREKPAETPTADDEVPFSPVDEAERPREEKAPAVEAQATKAKVPGRSSRTRKAQRPGKKATATAS